MFESSLTLMNKEEGQRVGENSNTAAPAEFQHDCSSNGMVTMDEGLFTTEGNNHASDRTTFEICFDYVSDERC